MLANRLPTDYQPTTNGLPTDQTCRPTRCTAGFPFEWLYIRRHCKQVHRRPTRPQCYRPGTRSYSPPGDKHSQWLASRAWLHYLLGLLHRLPTRYNLLFSCLYFHLHAPAAVPESLSQLADYLKSLLAQLQLQFLKRMTHQPHKHLQY